MADYLGLLREVATIAPPLFVFGGIAEAVLLDGRLDPSHGDIDVLTPRAELEFHIERLGDLGFAPFDVYYEPRPGLPLVFGSTRGGLALELSVLDYDPAGMPYFVLGADSGLASVALPADLFDWPSTIVSGVPVHTLSPLALVRRAFDHSDRWDAARLGRDGGADDPGLHGPGAGISPGRLPPGHGPTGPGVGRATRREERVRDGAGDDPAAAYCALAGRAVLLLGLRAAAVGHAAARDDLQPARSRRPLRAGRPLRTTGDLAGREVDCAE